MEGIDAYKIEKRTIKTFDIVVSKEFTIAPKKWCYQQRKRTYKIPVKQESPSLRLRIWCYQEVTEKSIIASIEKCLKEREIHMIPDKVISGKSTAVPSKDTLTNEK